MYNYQLSKKMYISLKEPFGNNTNGKVIDYDVILDYRGKFGLNVTFENNVKKEYNDYNICELSNIVEKRYWEKASDVPNNIKWILWNNIKCSVLSISDGGIYIFNFDEPMLIFYSDISGVKYIDINGNEKECLCTA